MFANSVAMLQGEIFLWIKALHVISVIAWMAGLLYLPRLFVYHTQVQVGSVASETFKIMERRLISAIMTPAMIASWVFGFLLLWSLQPWSDGWVHAKLTGVVLLTLTHFMMMRWGQDFALDRNVRSETFFRFANEIPTILMIAIVIFVIVKPF